MPNNQDQTSQGKTILSQRVRGDITCSSCHARTVVYAVPKGLEELAMRVLPRRRYQCLHCEDRFWASDGLFNYSPRAWVWALILLSTVIVSFVKFQTAINLEGQNRKAEFNPEFDQSVVEPVDQDATEGATEYENGKTVDSVSDMPPVRQEFRDLRSLDSLSPQQLEARVAQAKEQSEQSVLANEQRKKLLEKRFVKDQPELMSLLKIDINYRIERWRNAWQAGQVDYYLDFYSDQFRPSNGLTFEQWRSQRKQRILPSKKIDLALSNFDVSFDQVKLRSTVQFDQSYTSGSFSEVIRKQLVLVKEQQEWKIISEEQVDNQ